MIISQVDFQLEACEINESSTRQLLNNAQTQQLENQLKINLGDYHKKPVPFNTVFDVAFVNPARSGLREFTEQVKLSQAGYLIYISCFPETMAQDLTRLSSHYELCELKIVDQFPQTEHYEAAALLKKLS